MLIIAGMNAVLMFPAWFILKARLPPRTPPPLRSLLGPWRETRYACLVIGSSLLMAK
jgi:MCP family monocarboxylic acid transporter-like MFS transporter 10